MNCFFSLIVLSLRATWVHLSIRRMFDLTFSFLFVEKNVDRSRLFSFAVVLLSIHSSSTDGNHHHCRVSSLIFVLSFFFSIEMRRIMNDQLHHQTSSDMWCLQRHQLIRIICHHLLFYFLYFFLLRPNQPTVLMAIHQRRYVRTCFFLCQEYLNWLQFDLETGGHVCCTHRSPFISVGIDRCIDLLSLDDKTCRSRLSWTWWWR